MKSLIIAAMRSGRCPSRRQEEERHEHEVEEDDEQREVLGQSAPSTAGLGEAQPEEEQARALPVALPAHSVAGDEQHRGQRDEEEVQPVDAELVVDAELG